MHVLARALPQLSMQQVTIKYSIIVLRGHSQMRHVATVPWSSVGADFSRGGRISPATRRTAGSILLDEEPACFSCMPLDNSSSGELHLCMLG